MTRNSWEKNFWYNKPLLTNLANIHNFRCFLHQVLTIDDCSKSCAWIYSGLCHFVFLGMCHRIELLHCWRAVLTAPEEMTISTTILDICKACVRFLRSWNTIHIVNSFWAFVWSEEIWNLPFIHVRKFYFFLSTLHIGILVQVTCCPLLGYSR